MNSTPLICNDANGYRLKTDRESLELLGAACSRPADRRGAGPQSDVSLQRRRADVDARNAALVRFDEVQVPLDALVGELGQGQALLQSVIDRATVACARRCWAPRAKPSTTPWTTSRRASSSA
jgi:hypothetical protein